MSQQRKLRAVIVDDETHCITTLAWELETSCPDCEVVASFTDSTEALARLPTLEHDVLFLDIEMPQLNGFELLNRLGPEHRGHLIFTTAYSEYAVKAFKYSAVDYLLKPVDRDDLVSALAKVPQEGEGGPATQSPTGRADGGALKVLFDNLDAARHGLPMRLSLPTSEGWELVELADIIRCRSDGSYTDIYLAGGRKITISRNLKQLEESLPSEEFQRVHHSHLINLKHVRRFVRQDGGVLVMSDDSEVVVARSRKEQVLALLR